MINTISNFFKSFSPYDSHETAIKNSAIDFLRKTFENTAAPYSDNHQELIHSLINLHRVTKEHIPFFNNKFLELAMSRIDVKGYITSIYSASSVNDDQVDNLQKNFINFLNTLKQSSNDSDMIMFNRIIQTLTLDETLYLKKQGIVIKLSQTNKKSQEYRISEGSFQCEYITTKTSLNSEEYHACWITNINSSCDSEERQPMIVDETIINNTIAKIKIFIKDKKLNPDNFTFSFVKLANAMQLVAIRTCDLDYFENLVTTVNNLTLQRKDNATFGSDNYITASTIPDALIAAGYPNVKFRYYELAR